METRCGILLVEIDINNRRKSGLLTPLAADCGTNGAAPTCTSTPPRAASCALSCASAARAKLSTVQRMTSLTFIGHKSKCNCPASARASSRRSSTRRLNRRTSS